MHVSAPAGGGGGAARRGMGETNLIDIAKQVISIHRFTTALLQTKNLAMFIMYLL